MGSRRVLGLALLTLAALPAGAHAGSISYAPPYTYGSYYTTYTGAPGEANDMRIDGTIATGHNPLVYPAGSSVRFTDLVGIQTVDPAAGCTGESITYLCPWSGNNGRYTHIVRARLGDGDDRLRLRQTEAEASRVLGEESDCPYFSNRCVAVDIDAGPGADYIDVADSVNSDAWVACGAGWDVVHADHGDSVAADCEDVSRGHASTVARGGRLTMTIQYPGSYYESRRYSYIGEPGVENDMRVDLDASNDPALGPTGVITDLTGFSQTAGCTGFSLRYVCTLEATRFMGDYPDTLLLELGDGADRIRIRDRGGESYRTTGTAVDCAVYLGPISPPGQPVCQSVAIDAGTGDDYIDVRDGYRHPGVIGSCGDGWDTVKVDAGEAAPADCESVSAT